MLICRIKHCTKPRKVTGDRLCAMHWKRKWLYGSPAIVRRALNGSGYRRPDGYIRVYRNGKHDLLHRWIMRDHLKRPLTRFEIVHHKDGNKRNNKLSNLEIMTLPNHNRHHFTKIKNGMKPCSACRKTKALFEFYRDRHNGVYRPSSRCRLCVCRANKRIRRQRDLDKTRYKLH